LLRNSIAIVDVFLDKFLDGGGGYIGYRFFFNPFGEILHCDDGEGVISLCWYKFAHDIDAPSLQGLGWSYQLRWLHGSLAAIREFLTGFVGCYQLGCIINCWPIKSSLKDLSC
jgi:hypothetical protein